MTLINVPLEQQLAISAVDVKALHVAVDKCLHEQRSTPIHELGLRECGSQIGRALDAFHLAIDAHSRAKTSAKWEQTKAGAMKAGSDLVHVVCHMKGRIETEQKEALLFFIDDQIRPPLFPSKRLSVSIPFGWRQSTSSDWKHGQIAFDYDYDPRPDFSALLSERKSSASKAARERENTLYREWDRLKMQALLAVREFFRNGGDGDSVPEVFSIRPNPHGGGLNNHSCRFWQQARSSSCDPCGASD
ncbi:hypothetical protein [Pseudomonas monteilii]|uniref:hypothetical protein n=1 Tax=Pseudomonas monteilii TaxID=76759 RepID=UPI0007621FBC|nr:hypothetical protein [Pseudomonas monteilii]